MESTNDLTKPARTKPDCGKMQTGSTPRHKRMAKMRSEQGSLAIIKWIVEGIASKVDGISEGSKLGVQ